MATTHENDDVQAWLANEIPLFIRELPRMNQIAEVDIKLSSGVPVNQLMDRVNNYKEAQAQKDINIVTQLVMNLMRIRGGQEPTGLPDPHEKWPIEDMIGDTRNRNNMGNAQQFSSAKPKTNLRPAQAVSPKPGWWYRMVWENRNVLSSQLIFIEPDKIQEGSKRRKEGMMALNPKQPEPEAEPTKLNADGKRLETTHK
jgi:hypothetical protein